MYWSNQTLYHKETHKIAALHPQLNIGSAFNWEIGHNTSFIDEFGNKFTDDIKNWTNFVDWFDRGVAHTREKSTSKFVETGLRQFLVFGEQREINKKKALEEWRDKILKQLETEDEVRSWYADGSKCILFKEYFMKYVKAKPLVESWCSIMREFVPRGHTFKYKGRKFLIGFGVHSDITLIKT